MVVKVIEYRLPNGKQINQQIDISDEYQTAYEEMKRMQCWLTMELLHTGIYSITISDEDQDWDISLSGNSSRNSLIESIETVLKRSMWTDKALETSNEHI
jgi:hypothetical protein